MFITKQEFEAEIKRLNSRLNIIFVAGKEARAYRSVTNQALINNTWTQVQLNAKTHDPGGNFDLTNYWYNVPGTGLYLIIGQVTFALIQSGRYMVRIDIDVDDVVYAENQLSTVSNYVSFSVKDIRRLTKGQKVKLMAYQNSGTDTPVILAGTKRTYLSICQLL